LGIPRLNDRLVATPTLPLQTPVTVVIPETVIESPVALILETLLKVSSALLGD
jgi:hypothetical protein